MKKVISIFVLVLMIFAVSITAFAELEEKTFLDGKILMKTPENYVYIGTDLTEIIPELEEIGATLEDIPDFLDGANHIYLEKEFEGEIDIYYEEVISIPFSLCTEDELLGMANQLKGYYEEVDFEVVDFGANLINGINYIWIETAETDEDYPMFVYKTVYNDICLDVLYYYYGDGKISNKDINDFLGSLKFTEEEEYITTSYPVEYSVDGTETKITLPAGWCEYSNFDGKFEAIKNRSVFMDYYIYDGWSEFSEEDKSYVKRSELGMDSYTLEDFKGFIESEENIEIYNELDVKMVEDSIEMIKCGEYDCVSWKVEANVDKYIFKEATLIMYFENANGHIFFFSGPFEGEAAEEYKGIVASMKLPEIPDEGGEKENEVNAARIVLKALRYGIIGSVLAGIGSLIKNATKEIKSKKQPKENENTVITQENTETEHRFCSECGAQLAPDDKFCPLCGAKVKR